MLRVVALLALCVLVLSENDLAPFNYNPVADPKAIVISGNARFTVLTNRLIRMEYSSAGFEDRATLAVVNRRLPVPSYTTSSDANNVYIQTDSIKLSYAKGKPFASNTLTVTSLKQAFPLWHYGDVDSGNLLGTIKSLDGISTITLNCTDIAGKMINGELLHCQWGLISRTGWATIDDHDTPLMDSTNYPIAPNSNDQVDTYILAYGTDYYSALSDYTKIGGRIAMVPRYMTGIMWSVWYDLNNADVVKIVSDYESRSLPLDVFVLDMDWHTKNDWTGYTWDYTLFPNPKDTLAYLKDVKGLHLSANLHDDTGIGLWEQYHNAAAQALGWPLNKGIPFQVTNKTYMHALEDLVLKPVEDDGMDFWWIDWQQGGTQGGCTGGKWNPTIILNHVRCTDHIRRGESIRGHTLARWGGLGSHRYQIGFSGDVAGLTWKSLAYQPYFSATATNVGFGFWSHDIVGPFDNHELHTRWIQFASFSGAFRTHDRGMSAGGCADGNTNTCGIVKLWDVPTKYFEANRDAVSRRAALLPYLYNLAREAYDNGIGPTRPMYYDFPNEDQSYQSDMNGNCPQYMLGKDILFSAIVSPMDQSTNLTEQTIWLPTGVQWFEEATGTLRQGGQQLSRHYDLTETALFVKSGAVIPRRLVVTGNTVGLAQQQYTDLSFDVYPTAGTTGGTQVYQDDGYTMEYLSLAFATVKFNYAIQGQNSMKVTIVTEGAYAGQPSAQNYRIAIRNSLPPTSVVVNGKQTQWSRFPGPNVYWYDGEELTTVVSVYSWSVAVPLTVTLQWANNGTIFPTSLNGVKGVLRHAVLAKAALDEDRSNLGAHNPIGGRLATLSSAGAQFSYFSNPQRLDQFNSLLSGFQNMYFDAVYEVLSMAPPDNSLVQLFSGARNDYVLCGTTACMGSNNNYQAIRVEGFQADPNESYQEPLFDYWNAQYNDNWVTTDPNVPAGYVAADFSNGYVLSQPKTSTMPLQLFYNPSLDDHITVATHAGQIDALGRGYQLANSTLGYVYSYTPGSFLKKKITLRHNRKTSPLKDVAHALYAMALLDAAME